MRIASKRQTIGLFVLAGLIMFAIGVAADALDSSQDRHLHPTPEMHGSDWVGLAAIGAVVIAAAWLASNFAGAVLNCVVFFFSYTIPSTVHALILDQPIGHDLFPLTYEHSIIAAGQIAILLVLTSVAYGARRLTSGCS